LHIINENEGKMKLEEVAKKTEFEIEVVKKMLDYLVNKKCLTSPFIFGFLNDDPIISNEFYSLTDKGREIIVSGLSFQEVLRSELRGIPSSFNQTTIHGNQNQVAQTSGDNSSITQIQDNSKINVLKQLIENDKELDEPKKKKLFGILEKFNTLKQSGENAYELIKQVGLIAVKYVPLFFGLLN